MGHQVWTVRRLAALFVALAGGVFVTFSVASAHHRHHWFYHFANFPGASVNVYACSPVSTSAVQTVVANYNNNGGLGTVLNYSGSGCSGANAIIVKEDGSLCSGCGRLVATNYSQQSREILKDSTQRGRVYYQGISGQLKLANADAVTYSGSDKAVIAHEIGHALGLHERYTDTHDPPTPIPNCSYSTTTVMDCSGADQGPAAHDASDLSNRWATSPWGTGAIWISNDFGGSTLTLNWADINDNETNHAIYKNGAFLQNAGQDSQFANISGLSGGECFYIIVSNGVGSNSSSQVCRGGVSAPSAPSGASASTTNNYTASLSWTTNASSGTYTHEWVSVYKSGSLIAQYYVPHHGSGGYSLSIALGVYDGLPGTYSMEVYTCNTSYNAWNGVACVYGTGTSVYLSQ